MPTAESPVLTEIRELIRTGQFEEAFRQRERLMPEANSRGPARGLYLVVGAIHRMETTGEQEEIEPATLAPFEGLTSNSILGGGVWDAQRRLCENSMLRRLWGFRQTAGSQLSPPRQTREGAFVYGGLLVMQYGHFILESLSRAYAFDDERNRSKPIVFQNIGPARRVDDLPGFSLDIFELLEIDRKRIVIDNDGGRYERMSVPLPGYVAQTYFNERHRRFLCSRSAISSQRRYGMHGERYDGRSFYLSKARISGSIEERAFQDGLRELGVATVFPEDLPLDEQLSVFAYAKNVIGIAGSAFHTMLFLERIGATIFMIQPRERMNENFQTVNDRIAAAQGDFRSHVLRAFTADGGIDFAGIRGQLDALL